MNVEPILAITQLLLGIIAILVIKTLWDSRK